MGCIDSRIGFLTRLARDIRGNTLAIMAAALIPLAGLIGGGVDMSRLYLVKSRLQQSCDAGALAGRKAMAAGAWTTGSGNGSTNDKAEKMFATNFSSGQYGSATLTKGFTESNGIVTGTAGVTVPMTIMKVFGMTSRALSVTCQAKMELPNTDVMFVLDVTYSMQCAPSATSDNCTPPSNVNGRRITGLKKAVKCFYEALMKVGTAEPCHFVNDNGTPNDTSDDNYNSVGDPTATTASTTAQVRIGFVPYGVNVNVGRILPNSFMANNWTYQTREAAATVTQHAWNYVTPGSPPDATDTTLKTVSWGNNWTTPPASSFYDTSKYGSFSLVAGTDTVTFPMADGRNLVKKATSPTDTATCDALNIYGSSTTKVTGVQQSLGSTSSTIATPNPNTAPVWVSTSPANPNNQNQSITHNRTNTVNTGYRYRWFKNTSVTPNVTACWLESASKSNPKTYTSTETGTGTKQIAWTDYPGAWNGWVYKAKQLNVSALKTGGSTWATSIALPIGKAQSGPSVTLSGSTTSDQIWYPADSTVTWDGCIEEARTVQNTDQDPTGEWNTLPANAYDMNVNLIPDGSSVNPDWGSALPSAAPTYTDNTHFSPGTFWGPMLADGSSGAVWARYPGSTTSAWTQSTVSTTTDLSQSNYSYICTSAPARKLATYTTSTDFVSYVNSLDAQDYGTQHDIGMLWGGRLISPLGIFASENAQASTGGAIQRHLIFMTDGNTRTVYNNYDAYGLGFFNRFKTSYDPTCPGASPYTCTYTDDIVNERLGKICSQIKNMNIQLWVVSYGSAINTDTEDRLRACATDSQHFFAATDTATLNANFQTIAAKISALRLTG